MQWIITPLTSVRMHFPYKSMKYILLACVVLSSCGFTQQEHMQEQLEKIRAQHELPALGALVIVDGKIKELQVVGVRKHGDVTKVEKTDKFHIGSCTKAFTATLLAILIEEGKLRWETTLGEIFPEIKNDMAEDVSGITIEQLLQNRGGFSENSAPRSHNLLSLRNLPGSEKEQRYTCATLFMKEPLQQKPGKGFIYSNAGYTIAGAVAEKITGKTYQELLQEKLFKPLNITSAGYGAMGESGKISQPYQHNIVSGKPFPIEPSPMADNPPVLTPAGRLHLSLEDWAKFIMVHLDAQSQKLLKPETIVKIQAPPKINEYAMGWIAVERQWADGIALTHAGSNTINFAVAWLAPKKNFAVLVVTNIGGDKASQACDEVASYVIQTYLK